MKKMMTNMKTLVALLMAGAAVTSCSSDNEMDSPKAPAGKTYTMTVQATKGGDAMTRALELGEGGKTLNATWATTENVYVKKGSDWANGSLKPQTAGASTTLKGTLSGVTFAVDDELTLQFPKSGDITYAGQKGTLADIAANFDWAIAENVWVTSVDGDGNIDTGENVMEFEHQQAIVRFTLKNSDGTALPSNPTAFTMTDGSSTVELTNIPAETYTTNGAGVLYVAFPASNGDADITLTATVGTDTYTCTASSKTFTVGKFYRVTAKMTEVVPEAVDLGLPSGTLWANMNVGAASEGDYGQFFAWGETTGYGSNTADGHNFGWASYSLCGGSNTTLTKYNNDGNKGTVDNKTTLEAADDAATANWGGDWRMPTKAELEELLATKSNTTDYTWTWTTVGGHNGWRITSNKSGTSGNSIFLPAAGDRYGASLNGQGSGGYYWSSTLGQDGPYSAWGLYFVSGDARMYNIIRYSGYSVRPVQGAAAPAVPEGAISGQFSVSATKKVYFSKGNLRYASSKWSFFDNQYDYYTSYSAAAWDKFGWSTSATTYGMNTSEDSGDYSGEFVDWGATMGSGWRTLTGGDGGEWEYLFGTNPYYKRTTTSGLYFAKATINTGGTDVVGVILLPDDWSTSNYTLSSTNSTDAAFDTNTISESDWSSKLESHGCVFLPAAGYRDYGTMVRDVGDYGGYWSSTAHGSDEAQAHDVYFDSGNVGPEYAWDRYRGFSVRLVHDVE